MKRAFIIHGWGGNPEEGWFPWLKKGLEIAGFKVEVPQMPEADAPKISNWVPALAKAVGKADKETFLIGHSMGCQTIVRYLETIPEGVNIGGAVFVAGFLKRLTGLETPDEEEIASSWLNTPIDYKKVKQALPRSVAIFSDTDVFVPLDNRDEFENILESRIIVEKNQKGNGHFSGSDGVTKLPSALKAMRSFIE